MTVSTVITPIAMVLELIICAMGIYAGYALKKRFGFLFAATFLLFAFFDYFGSIGVTADNLAILNIIAILAALAGMYMVLQEKKS